MHMYMRALPLVRPRQRKQTNEGFRLDDFAISRILGGFRKPILNEQSCRFNGFGWCASRACMECWSIPSCDFQTKARKPQTTESNGACGSVFLAVAPDRSRPRNRCMSLMQSMHTYHASMLCIGYVMFSRRSNHRSCLGPIMI